MIKMCGTKKSETKQKVAFQAHDGRRAEQFKYEGAEEP